MHYLNRLKNADIYSPAEAVAFAVFGGIQWAGTLVAYLWLYMVLNDNDNTIASNFVLAIAINHGAVLLLTGLDAIGPAGRSIVLQTFIIAHGSFNTFALGGILGGTLAGPAIEDAFYPALLSLALACFANAQMVASLFALFHRSIDIARGFDTRMAQKSDQNTLDNSKGQFYIIQNPNPQYFEKSIGGLAF